MKTILANIKQGILGKSFYISLLIFIIMLTFSLFGDFLEVKNMIRESVLDHDSFSYAITLDNGYHSTLFFKVLYSEIFILIAPILCALPFSSIFIDEIKSGFIKSYLSRTSRKNYLLSKIIGSVFSGGALAVFTLVAIYLILLLIIAPFEKSTLPTTYYFYELINKIPLVFCFGGMNSVVGLALGTATQNKYMCYLSPFVLIYMMIILQERYFPNYYVISAKEWLNPQNQWMFGDNGVIILLLEIIALFSLLFWVCAKRRIESL